MGANTRGRATTNEVWVFEVWVFEHTPAQGICKLQPGEMLPLCFPSYKHMWFLAPLPNVASHSTVNHSIAFIHPTIGSHMQNVESYWAQLKIKFKRMKGCHAHQLLKNSCGGRGRTKMQAFTRDIADFFPV
jgi:hypothetical protein